MNMKHSYWLGVKVCSTLALVLTACSLGAAQPGDDPFAAKNQVKEPAAKKSDDPFGPENEFKELATVKPGDDPFAPENAFKGDPFAKKNPAPKKDTESKCKGKHLARGELIKPPPPASGKKRTSTHDLIDFEVAIIAREDQDSARDESLRRGEVVTLVITGTPLPGHYTYPYTRVTATQTPRPPAISEITYSDASGLKPLWPMTETMGAFKDTQTQEGIVLVHKKRFTVTQDLLVEANAKPGVHVLKFQIYMQVCNKSKCIPGTLKFEVPFTVSATEPVPLTAEVKKQLTVKEPKLTITSPKGAVANKSGKSANGNASGGSGLLAFVLSGVFWGGVSLITPCVFPMIPITVSFFLKQSENKNHKPLLMASVYCGTIVIVLSIAAIALLSLFRALSTNPIMNIGLGGLFVFFALSLFGMYDIELPSGLARFTSAKEGQGGIVGTIFMALTFTIISFACVAPFLGGFGGTADFSQLTLLHRILGGLAFSVTFAAPFFVLALFPSLLKAMPKSGSWLNTVKVVMGFLELAAAFKFFRTGELVLLPEPMLFTYDFTMGLYVAVSLLCGLYLLNVYRLPHDTPAEHLGVPRLMFSLAFLALGFYLMPGLFKDAESGASQRPKGAVFAWVDSFLLPAQRDDGLPWKGDIQLALKEALEKDQLVFIDFTGETCTNCKLNEENVFPNKDIRDLFKQYTLVKLYTDKVPNKLYPPEVRDEFGLSTSKQRADALKNLEFQRKEFGTEQLPLYVVLKPLPGGKWEEIDVYDEGKINDTSAFVQFLREPLNTRVAAR